MVIFSLLIDVKFGILMIYTAIEVKNLKIGLIDLGSNTIKMNIYQCHNKQYQNCFYDANYTYIINDVQNDRLTTQGIDKIIQTIKMYQTVAQQQQVDLLSCFSTASLRHIQNQKQVVDEVFKATGIQIQPLTGKQEAYFNLLSMQTVVSESEWIGGDLGGGSLQLFCLQQQRSIFHQSLPLGSLKLYQQFVSDQLPTVQQARCLEEYVAQMLSTTCQKPNFSPECIYFMGGSVRTARYLISSQSDDFSTLELQNMIERCLSFPQWAKQQIQAIQPERLKTVIPGMLVVNQVCNFFGVSRIKYTSNSVREGYLISLLEQNMLDKGKE